MERLRFPAAAPPETAKRPIFTSLRRGFACRCPSCGKGRLFDAFLKVSPACSVCGEDLSHHRADDAPPYLTMVVTGHVVVPIALMVETTFSPPTWASMAFFLPLTLVTALALLQPIKGAVVGLQWALRMHGFSPDGDPNDPREATAPLARPAV